MADALCGPSNSLQTFQKQTQVDRTLQQDRLTSRHSPAEGFRSTLGRNAGILDAEFEAFQAGQPLGNQLPDLQPFPYGSNAASFPSNSIQLQTPEWASDFQKLHISSPQPSQIPQIEFRQQASGLSYAPGAWHQDFMGQQSQSYAQPQRSGSPGTLENPIYGGGRYGHGSPAFSQLQSLSLNKAFQVQSDRQVGDLIDDSAFERAFDAAHSRIQQLDDHMQQEIVKVAADVRMEVPWEDELNAAVMTDLNRVGSDRILDKTFGEMQANEGVNDADELARTAGQLLDNLKHDQSQKFQESNFLSLMRQLRDREVRVEGDKLVEASQPLHPGGKDYPNENIMQTSEASGAYHELSARQKLAAERRQLSYQAQKTYKRRRKQRLQALQEENERQNQQKFEAYEKESEHLELTTERLHQDRQSFFEVDAGNMPPGINSEGVTPKFPGEDYQMHLRLLEQQDLKRQGLRRLAEARAGQEREGLGDGGVNAEMTARQTSEAGQSFGSGSSGVFDARV